MNPFNFFPINIMANVGAGWSLSGGKRKTGRKNRNTKRNNKRNTKRNNMRKSRRSRR